MVKFLIDKTVRLKTIKVELVLLSLDSLFVDVSVHFKLNYVTPFTVLYNVVVSNTAIVQCKCYYNLNHTKLSSCAFNHASDL